MEKYNINDGLYIQKTHVLLQITIIKKPHDGAFSFINIIIIIFGEL